jgi:DNA-binding response OmpR family regulator
MARLLVIEDDEDIGELLQSGLELHGHEVDRRRTGNAGLEASAGGFDLVLLDLGLPDLDGLEVCRRLRLALPATVIVILTARSREMDIVVGLEVGADDYLTKPVRLAELVARIRAHLRRAEPAEAVRTSMELGDLTVDVGGRRASVAGHDIALRPREFDLLARLAAEPGTAVSRETLMAEVWDEHWFGSTKTLDVHVAALRRKLAGHRGELAVPQIVTVRGHGYRIEVDE